MKSQELAFPYIGNNLALDFLNTRIISRGETIDLLDDAKDLASWARGAGIPLEGVSETTNLTSTLELRDALTKVFTAVLNDKSISTKSLSTLNQHLLNHSSSQKLQKIKDKLTLLPLHKKFSIDRLLGHIANEAAQLLASNKLEKLKKCSNPKCILLFLDTSKSGKRRWCSMDVCGNRAKAANHYLSSKH